MKYLTALLYRPNATLATFNLKPSLVRLVDTPLSQFEFAYLMLLDESIRHMRYTEHMVLRDIKNRHRLWSTFDGQGIHIRRT